MNNRFTLVPLIATALFLSSCTENGNPVAVSGNDTDTAYSGAKYNDHIRSTDARTAEQERMGFRLPEGFEINLYASEPDIAKPINFNFDAKGRMWVTQSYEYPFAAQSGKGKDRVTILEDTDGDGKADKFIHFEDTLNIPIGIMPIKEGAVVYTIPNVIRFEDANGDGKPESSRKLMGPFEVKDTHGMVNNFTTGFDGWIHACHGYTNRSNVAGTDGDSVHLISGNTIRFRPDGSRVEQVTAGRINPFGLAYDELGYLYSTDCHTSPLYQMIRGGDYSQWGKDEGMGFAPDMKPFSNEATALAGLAYYADNKWPEEYKKNLFIGDVVASRIYRNSFVFKGTSPVGKREPDFLMSLDPWFRPVAVQMGPDGAMYIADFYNSIIGHYEVPLDHPKRDKIRGRIWRITYKGKADKKTDWSKATLEELFKALNADNLKVRMTAGDQLVDHYGTQSIAPVKALIAKKEVTETEYVQGLWALQRLGALTDDIARAAVADPNAVIRLHALRAMAEQKDTSAVLYPVIAKALQDENPHVRRAAVELMGRYPDMKTVELLIAFRKKIAEEDTHLIYTVRLVLRNLLRKEFLMQNAVALNWSNEDAAVLSSVLVGVENPSSGAFLYNYVKTQQLPEKELPKTFMHIIRFIPAAQMNQVISLAMNKAKEDPRSEYQIFKYLQQGLQKRPANEPPQFASWGKSIVGKLMAKEQNVRSSLKQEEIDEQFFAVTLAGDYKINSIAPRVSIVLQDSTIRDYVRQAAVRSLMKMDPEKNAVLIGKVLQNPFTTPDFKRTIVTVLSEFTSPSVSTVLAQIKNAAPDLQFWIVMALANSNSGREVLLSKVKKGEIFARNLAEPKVEERMMLNSTPAQKKMYKELTASVGEIDKEKQTLISERIADYNNLNPKPAADSGNMVFVKNCAPCHNIKGNGGHIGPQLDGVGKWGVTSLMEKILDPNRNVSENFRNYTVKLKDGKVLSGLYRRDEGAVIVYADVKGQEFSVSKKDIAVKTPSRYTLMPDQFRNTIDPNDFNKLISYLISQKN